ncbi:VOC family protein [Pseudooceanicola sp. MF1-13]|uniref:VOC family protein n=1 Tax=Pseudooceanicola sp. MF1-13 TaxID=3379095 RepID=UPI0038912EC4
MTAITGKIGITKRPGELGVHSMDQFNMVVPDLTKAETFYREFGLDVREEGETLGLYTFGHDHRWATLKEGNRKKFDHLSFAVFEEDFDGMKKRIEDQGVQLMDAPRGIDSNGIWFRDPFGVLIEVKVAEKSSPNEKSTFTQTSAPANVAGAPLRSKVDMVHPRRLAHVLLFTPDVAECIRFYCRVLGLRLSDQSGEGVCFLHGIHGSDHHMIAFAKSEAPGLHHCSWDVGNIDEIGRGAMHMADKGFQKGWGLGRHVLGSNYFHYVTDPWGSHAEYSADIDYISLDEDWEPGDHAPEDSFYLWGPELPADFVRNYEADPVD